MKQIMMIFFAAVSLSLSAQTKEGTIIYERKMNMHRNMPNEQLKAMIPEFRTSKHILLFSDSSSVYKLLPEEEAPDPFGGGNGGGTFVVRMGSSGDNGELFKDFTLSKSIQLTELGAKQYIIEDSILKQRWKLSDETKTIGGHVCQKATTKQTIRVAGARVMTIVGSNTQTDTTTKTNNEPQTKEVDVIAWYATDIISPVGPENNGGLPGVILELDINNKETVYTAIDIKNTVNKKDIKEPKKGKRVTRDEFRKLQMDMIQNMQMPAGGGSFRFGN